MLSEILIILDSYCVHTLDLAVNLLDHRGIPLNLEDLSLLIGPFFFVVFVFVFVFSCIVI